MTVELIPETLEVTPRLGYVLAKELKFDQKRGGIHLPGDSGLQHHIGEILDIGPSHEKSPVDDLAIGDHIMVESCFMADPATGRVSATMLQIDNERWLVHASDIVAIVKVKK